MTLKKALDSVVCNYLSKINNISEFVRVADETLNRTQAKCLEKIKEVHSEDEIIELRTIVETLLELLKRSAQNKRPFIPASHQAINSLFHFFIPYQEKQFLAEMSLSYLVSYQEAFIKDYLFQLLIHRKQMLKSGASVTYNDILEHTSLKSLVNFLAQKELDGLAYGSIDDICKYFLKKLNIDLGKFNKWKQLREINYRRNIIIHNRSVANEIYCEKTSYKKLNEPITTDYEYVSAAVDVLFSFIDFIHTNCLLKFKLSVNLGDADH